MTTGRSSFSLWVVLLSSPPPFWWCCFLLSSFWVRLFPSVSLVGWSCLPFPLLGGGAFLILKKIGYHSYCDYYLNNDKQIEYQYVWQIPLKRRRESSTTQDGEGERSATNERGRTVPPKRKEEGAHHHPNGGGEEAAPPKGETTTTSKGRGENSPTPGQGIHKNENCFVHFERVVSVPIPACQITLTAIAAQCVEDMNGFA